MRGNGALEISPRLCVLVIGDQLSSTHPLPPQGSVTLGRSPANEIFVDHASVSRRHARLTIGGEITIEDLGSANGTRVRNVRLAPGETVTISPGEVVEVGATLVIIQQAVQPVRWRRTWSHEYFEARLDEECSRGESTGSEFAVLHMRANPGVADSMVESVMLELLRSVDVVGSYAPGHYEVLLGQTGADEAAAVTRRMVARLAEEGCVVHAGIATYPGDGRDPDSLIGRATVRARGERAARSASSLAPEGAMQSLHKLAERIAVGNISVLIMGETGVGKEVMAETIHRLSPRRAHPFLRLNCAALSESLLESELFGHERGAFTGAVMTKPGLLETADKGTVFLDEIGELPMGIQVKLLRVLEERMVLRVGGLKARAIDVRFIAATHRDLESESERGRFRQDLYFRLNGISLVIPPLRERVGEIEELARLFIATVSPGGTAPPELSRESLALLRQYHWPGNIRELRNMMERSVLLCGGTIIRPEHLPLEKMRAGRMTSTPFAAPIAPPATPPPAVGSVAQDADIVDLDFAREARTAERKRIIDAMRRTAGNQSQAAKLLGISRRTLLSKLDVHNLPRPRKRIP